MNSQTNMRLPDRLRPIEAPLAAQWTLDDEWLECVQVRHETHDVKTFVFAPLEARSFRYRPGQFMTFSFTIGEQNFYRCYTLSSTPTRPDTVSITVKRVARGRVSNWLHDRMRIGMRLNAAGPNGEFSCFASEQTTTDQRKLLLVSGGSGITPTMSMSRALHDLSRGLDVVFVHASRTPGDIIFADELALLARCNPGFRYAVICEQRGPAASYAGWLGRLNASVLQAMAPDLLEREVFCCGPAPFMTAVREMLPNLGYPMDQYREESFTFDTSVPTSEFAQVHSESQSSAGVSPPEIVLPVSTGVSSGAVAEIESGLIAETSNTISTGQLAAPTAFAIPAPSGQTFWIQISKGGQRFACASDQTVLLAARAAGLRWPFSCGQGMCGTCRTQKTEGEVAMAQNGGLRPKEVRAGWILPCCSRPLSDLLLDK